MAEYCLRGEQRPGAIELGDEAVDDFVGVR